MTEQILADLATASGLRSICLRYFNVAGADPLLRSGQISPEATHLIKVISQVVVGQRPQLTIFGNDYPTADGTCERDYIHVSDLVDAHYLALAHLRAGGGSRIFNCGYGRGTSVSQVVSACEKVAGRVVPVKLGPRREGDPAVLVADSSSIRQELGWTPRHDKLETIIRTALDWEARVASLAPRT